MKSCNESPLVSIIIPVYNGADFVKKAIESAIKQTYKNIEVIVVNDGSNDNGKTEEVILEFGDQIKYFYKENGGVASALNFGIKNMKGEYFSWLSHDDVYLLDKIEKQIDLIYKYGKETVIYGNFNYINKEDKVIGEFRADRQYKIERLEYSRFPVYQGLIHGCTVLFHKDHFKRVGLFDVKLRTSQDYDFWWRLFYRQNIKFLSSAYTNVRRHSKQGSNTEKTFKTEENNYFIHFIKDIDNDEIRYIYNSLKNFYWQMYLLCENNKIYDAARYAKKKFIEQKNTKSNSFKRILEEKYKGKKLAIFGFGYWGKWIFRELETRGIEVNCFLDNDIKKKDTNYYGILCKNELKNKSQFVVVVAVQNDYEVIQQMNNENYPYYINYFDIMDFLFCYPPELEEEL